MKEENLNINSKDRIKNKKVAMYMNMASMSPVIELHTALINDLLSRGNNVTIYLLDRSFKSPTDNPFNRRSIFNYSRYRIKSALDGKDLRVKEINLNSHSNGIPENKLETIELGVMSSLASSTKAQNKGELNRKWTRVYDNMFDSAKRLYNYFMEEIGEEGYDFVFMFNGRFGCVKPVLEATRDSGVGFGLNEVKKTVNEVVFVNELVHSIQANTRKAFEFYDENPTNGDQAAKDFFGKKVKHENTGDPVYTKSQQHGNIPKEIQNTDKKVVVVYPTTEDEFKFIGKEWDGHVPESQVDEIDKLAAGLPDEEYVVVIKMHPNQANSAENTLERYKEISEKRGNIWLEGPFSKMDTYAYMNRADVIVTFASTIGVEACYAGKPSVLIGDTTWSEMNVAEKVYDGAEAAKLIMDGVEPKPVQGALVWGYYLADYKDKLPGYEMRGNGDYYVDNRKIGDSRLRRLLQLPAKFEIETSKPGFSFNKAFFDRLKGVLGNIIKGKWAIK